MRSSSKSLLTPRNSVPVKELVAAAWPIVTGKRIAAHTSPAALVGRKLIVDVEDAVWQKQLFLLKQQILARFAEVAGDETVSDLEFRIVPTEKFVQARLPVIPDPPYRSKLGDERIQSAVEEVAGEDGPLNGPLLRVPRRERKLA